MGVEPMSPPDIAEYLRPPTVTDYSNFHVGDLWVTNNPSLAMPRQVHMLLDKNNNVGTWGQIYPSGAGAATDFLVTNAIPPGPVHPFAFQIGIVGDPTRPNITTLKDTGHYPNGNYIELALENDVNIVNSLTVQTHNTFGAVVQWNTGLFDYADAVVPGAGTVLMSNGAALPTFNAITFHTPGAGGDATLTAAGILNLTSATLTITAAGPNTVNFEVVGGGAVTDVRPDVGADVVPAAGLLKVYGAASAGGYINIGTSNAGADTLGIALADNIDFDNTDAGFTQGTFKINA